MNDGNPFVKRMGILMKQKKGAWVAVAALAVGVLLLILGGVGPDGGVKEQTYTVYDTSVLEEQVKLLCERVCGVDQVDVMITMDTLSEQIYASNSQVTSVGERSESRVEYVTASGALVPIGEELARVRGVAVVCHGGSDPAVRLTLTNMLTALFDIPSNAVSVVEGK